MTNDEYKKYLYKMIDEIDNNSFLKKIYEFVHYYFVKS